MTVTAHPEPTLTKYIALASDGSPGWVTVTAIGVLITGLGTMALGIAEFRRRPNGECGQRHD